VPGSLWGDELFDAMGPVEPCRTRRRHACGSHAASTLDRHAGGTRVVLSVVEQRLDVVRAVLAGAEINEVAGRSRCPGGTHGRGGRTHRRPQRDHPPGRSRRAGRGGAGRATGWDLHRGRLPAAVPRAQHARAAALTTQPAGAGRRRPAATHPAAGPTATPVRGADPGPARASATGVIVVAGQKVPLGRTHASATVSVHVAETSLAIELPDGETTVVPRTTRIPVRSIKGQRPRTNDRLGHQHQGKTWPT